MEHKSNSNKVNRQQREKVLRFSIRKYSFGAASVAVAALMFLGTHVVSANGVDDKNQSTIGAPNPKEKESPLVDPAKEGLAGGNIPVVDNNANTGKTVEKQALDKTTLQTNIEEVEELLEKVNQEKAPASTLAAIKVDLENAKKIFNSDSVELTQAEIDAMAKKLSENIFVLSSMPKINTPKKVVKEGENTIDNSGSRDSRNDGKMEEGSDFRSAPIDSATSRGNLGIVVANSGFITGYATPSSTIEIKKNGKTILTSKLDDTGAFKLNAPGIEVGDNVELVVNGKSVYSTSVSTADTVAFNDSLAGIAQVDGYTAAEADVEVTVGGKTFKTKSQTNGYFTINVDTNLMVKDAVVTTVIKKNGQEVGRGTSTVRETKVTDFGVGWVRNPMIDYSHRDVYSPDTKGYAFVSKGTADKAYDNIRVYREERIEKDGNRYYYWILDSGPRPNGLAGVSKKISLAIPRTVGDPYEFTYTKYQDGKQTFHKKYENASAWEYENSAYRAYVKDGERRSGATYGENVDAWMDYINPSNTWRWNIYRNSSDGTDRNPDAAPRVNDMLGIYKNRLEYNLVRGVIEDKMNIVAGQRSIITFKTKILEDDDLNNSIMSDWGDKNTNNPMLAEMKKRLANDPFLAYGGYTDGGYRRYRTGENAIIGVLPLKPEEAEKYDLKPKAKPQTTKVGVIPDAFHSIANPDELPKGTTYRWFKDPDVSKATAPDAPVYGEVEVIIPERGTFIVDAPIHVTGDKVKTPEAPSATAKEDGSVTAKPQDSTKVDKIKVSYIDEDGSKKTAEGNKGKNGTWTVANNPDVQIDANTGEITIPADKVKDNTEVIAVTKNGNSDESTPAKVVAKAPKPEAPIVTAPNTGVVTAKPKDPAKADKITVTYKDEEGSKVTVVGNKGKDGAWTVENNPGVTIDSNTGEITIPADKVKDNTEVTAITKNGNSDDSEPAKAVARFPKPEKPTVVAKEDGSVTAKPQDPAKADKITVTYTGEDGLSKKVVGTKDPFNQWTSDDPEIKINADTGEMTIPAEKVKNETDVTAITKNGTSDDSEPASDKAKTPDNEPPVITLSTNNVTVVEGGTITFTVTAKDDKKVTFELNGTSTDFLTKAFQSGRLNTQGTPGTVTTRYVKDTEKEKEIEITINTIEGDVGKQNTIIFGATDDANNKAKPVIFSFVVTPRDKVGPTISADGATVTSREPITPIPVTAKDNDGGVGMRENTPIEVNGLPEGLRFEEGKIVGTPTGTPGTAKVTITAYDKNDNPAEKTIEIVVKGQNDKYNPVGKDQTVPKNSTPNAEDSIANKTDLPQGTKYRWLTPPDTSQGGQTVSAVVVVEYPDQTTDNVSVNISVPTNLTAEVTKPNEVIEKHAVESKKVVTPNKDGSTITTPDAVNGLTVDNNGNLTGRPTVDNWGKDEEKRAITIPVKVTNGTEEITVSVPVTILRDTDDDGEPDTIDTDDDNDGIPDKDEITAGTDPKTPDTPEKPTSYGLTGVVKPSTVTENTDVNIPGVVKPNKENSTIETPDPVNGLRVDNDGKLTGRPTVGKWGEGEEERDITIPVKVKNGSEEANVIVPVKIQRDTDGDGNPDVTDTDDDNDGISDEDEKRNGTDPKVANGLTGIVTAPAKVKEKTPVPTTLPKVVTPNKEGSTITTENPVNELKVNGEGKLEGTPTVNDWVGGEEERNITIPVKITREKDGNKKEEVTVHVPVTIQRDTDGDGTPDVDDLDDDNDGISDEDEKRNGTDPKVVTALDFTVGTPADAKEKAEYTSEVVVTPNKPNSTITAPTVNGLTVNSEGKVTGKPTIGNWGDEEEERNVTISVTVTHENDQPVTKNVVVKVLRDTDGDGTPDVLDSDDDNDGIPDEVEKRNNTNPKVPDNLTATVARPEKVKEKKPVTPTKVVTPNMPNSTITTDAPDGSGEVNGLKVNNDGNLEGTPTVDNWKKDEEERNILIPVKVKNGDKETTVKVPVTIQRDTDGDGIPDVDDTDDDNDGIPDTVEEQNGTDPKAANDLEVTVTNPDKVKEKTPVTPTKVVTPNKEGSTIVTNTPDGTVNGLKVNGKGELEGTPTVNNWGKDEEERTIDIPVKVTKDVEKVTANGKETVTETVTDKVPVTIQRDTDGDGDPDVTDKDDDNDGIPDEVEKANGTDPKNANNLTAKVSDPTKVTEKTQVPSTLPKVVTPNKDGSTITTENPVNGLSVDKDGKLTGTPSVTNWGSDEELKVNIPVKVKNGDEEIRVEVPVIIQRDTDGDGDPDVTDKDDDNDGISDEEEKKNGTDPKVATTQTPKIGMTRKDNGDVVVTPTKPDGTLYPKDTKVEIPGENGTTIVVTIGDNGSGTVPNDQLPKTDKPGTGIVTEPNKEPSKPVDVTTPARKTPTVDLTQNPSTGDVTVTPKKIDGSKYPPGTTVTIPGKDGNPIVVPIGNDGTGTVPNNDLPERDVPGTAIITEKNQKPSEPVDITTPAKKVPTLQLDQDPKTGDVTVTPKKPDGTTYPPGTKVEIPGKNGTSIPVTIGKDGTGTVPNKDLPETDTPGTGKIKEDGKPEVEIKVETPKKIDPTAPETAELGTIEITTKPNGDAVVTPKTTDGKNYPKDTIVKIPGENGTSIVVTIGENGSGEVPNDQLPKYEVPGKGTVTEPGKKPSQPVAVKTPARKTPTVEMEQNPNTGDVTVTPKKPDGTTYPPGTKVEIPGKDGKTIEVTLDKDGKGTVPNNDLPDEDTPGTGKIKEDGKPEVDVKVETPKKINPNYPATEQPTAIDVTRKPNGDAIVTPKKPDKTPYPPGTTVKIPGENGTPIVVTIGKDGFGIVPNDKLPKDEVPGKGIVTEPEARPSQPVDVTTPARKPSTIRLDQDPTTGDVTVTPKKPDGSTYPPGTKVEIPGKNGNPITVTIGKDGTGKVLNGDLPDGNVPGTGKITEPGKPTTEAQVLTPGKINPLAPQTDQPGKIEITRNPNGDAVVTPKKPDGTTTYPPGTKVVIPGENGTPILVTIGDNGSGTVPNDKLPKEDITGRGIVTEPNKRPSQPVAVTTPARKTPTIELTQDPTTGDVTVTPKKPDGSTYPPGTKVEIPGKNGKPIVVTIGKDGSGTVSNNDLPDEDTPGTGRIKEPGNPTVEVKVETPEKIDPTAPQTEQPVKIDITTDKITGDAIVTPKKPGPDETPYPPGTKVKIPGENGTSIIVTIGDNGSGTVPNDQLPKEAKPGKGTVTEPNRKPSNPVDVTTPARKTPTVELNQDPNTGDVTVTPKKPDGTLYPEKTKVEIPGKNGKPIVVIIGKDGKGTIPNKDLPDGIEPGKGMITEPGKDPVEVIVTTPARKIPTVVLEPNPQTGVVTVTPDTNGGSGQDTSAPTPAPTTPTPDAVTPNATHEGTTDTIDNGAKSNDSQNVLPNTGTESNATLASLGLLGLLSGFGLVARKKKED